MQKANLGETSIKRRDTCHADLIRLINLVEKRVPFDITILEGHRSKERQYSLYQKGRTLIAGEWVITDKPKIVTKVDGFNVIGKHNYSPSKAFDLIKYPVDWKDTVSPLVLAGVVLSCASELGIDIRPGLDWDMDGDYDDQTFMDVYHFELRG
ncbi:MAG: hypothetical protein JKY81_01525 [Colwellia sp.]|nr:hypothetical protein [Colwellia sp.]